ncbi:MAG TPA: hypothetical protein VK427_09500 [Kofleriaceae bacterium]|nr:hypothetical protein [Kofleriaceae bacterium]
MRITWLLVLTACDAASPDPGRTAELQVEGAQFRPGAFPRADGGPATLALSTRSSMLIVDRFDGQLRGILEPHARAAAIGIAGDDDAWIVVAGPPDLDSPGQPTAKASFGLAASFPAGPFTLQLAAADEHGRFGEPQTTTVVALDELPPAGELVVGLYWEGRADLDLHVVDPLGGEAWSDDPNTYVPPPPGTPVDPEAYKAGGILDRDGNKDCRRDGRPREHVIWRRPPPTGNYVVRVDARAMCGDEIASWYAVAMRGGEVLGQARGIATRDDVLVDQDTNGRAGAGVHAFGFTLP